MQTQRFKTNSGSFQNLLMSNNSTTPIVGEYCTEMLYTDRNVWLVREVSKDGKTCKIESCNPTKLDHYDGYGSEFQPTGHVITLRWNRNAWRHVRTEYFWSDEFMTILSEEERAKVREIGYTAYIREYCPSVYNAIFNDDMELIAPFAGIVEKKTSYNPFRVLFGTAKHYRDPHF
jgi:hypothetical protein